MTCRTCIGVTGGTGSSTQIDSPYLYPRLSGAVSSDSISSVDHVIEFCEPMQGVRFNQNDEPLRGNCGIFSRNVDSYPLNDPTTLENGYYTFGLSEMVLAYVKLNNYPRSGGYIRFKFLNPSGTIFFTSTTTLPIPDPSWTWWYAWAWGVVGKFDNTSGYSQNEILVPGNYKVLIETTWGNAVIDYVITGLGAMPLIFEVQGSGSFLVYRNGTLKATARQSSPKTVTYYLGDAIAFQAYADAGNQLVSVCDVPQTECRQDVGYAYNVIGQLPQKMVAKFQAACTPNWQCEPGYTGYETDGCGNRRRNTACDQPPLVITNVTATAISAGNIRIGWTQSAAGNIKITKNGVQVFTWNETSPGSKTWESMNNQTGTYTFCVNGVCALPITISCTSEVFWCEEPKNGYEINSCGVRRKNHACDAPLPWFILTAARTTIDAYGESVNITATGRNGEVRLFERGPLGIGDTQILTGVGVNNTVTFSVLVSKKTTYRAGWKNYDGSDQWSTEVSIATKADQTDPWALLMQYGPYAIGALVLANIVGALRK